MTIFIVVVITWSDIYHRIVIETIDLVKTDNKTKYLGLYTELDDAIKIRKEAEEKYFGEWSYDKSRELSSEGEMV